MAQTMQRGQNGIGSKTASSPPAPASARKVRAIALAAGAFIALVGLATGATLEIQSVAHRMGTGRAMKFVASAAPIVTAPNPDGAAFLNQRAAVDPMFQAYYAAHQGTTALGAAVTPAVPVTGGWLQVYMSGALFLPDPTLADTARHLPADPALIEAKATLPQLIADGTTDAATGVVCLPLLEALLMSGSLVRIGQPNSGLTYALLRSAAQPDRMVRAPALATATATAAAASSTPGPPEDAFIPEAQRSGVVLGHTIPAAIMAALAQPRISPDGWQVDFGNPLTEPISTTTFQAGVEDILSIQVFEHGALELDTSVRPATRQASPTVRMLPVGLDYLRTFGPPSALPMSGREAWVSTPTALYGARPTVGAADVHVGTRFPLSIVSGPLWSTGQLWYEVSWQTPGRHGTAWVPGSSISFVQSAGIATAAFDALDPGLSSYLAGLGSRVGVVVYDVTRGMYYEDNPQGQFIVGSSIKVIFLLTLLQQAEAQGRGLTGDEMSVLTTMIENSDNDSASAVFNEIGGAPATNAIMQQLGVSGLSINTDAFGWSTITPAAMVQVLSALQAGKVLDAQDRTLALNLMGNIESDQQQGVGYTAPVDASVAMKDGWVTGPDGMWNVNTSGIVTVGAETYIISVYTGGGSSLEDGWEIINHVCQRVGQLLG